MPPQVLGEVGHKLVLKAVVGVWVRLVLRKQLCSGERPVRGMQQGEDVVEQL